MTNPLQHALAKIIGDAIFGYVHPDETPNTWGQSMSAAQDVLAAIVVNAAKAQTPSPAPQMAALVDEIMEQAQVFASACSLVGGRFDNGTKYQQSEDEKAELRRMIKAATEGSS